ncbi:MAG TPA: hypothetical protein VHF01_08640 [Candidatus Acidoferrum sp.]|nr:hypothetical protein [Candidatus Acidoferrum sp.]
MILRADVFKVRIREIHSRAAGVRFPGADDLVRIRVGQGAEEHAVNHAENRRTGANTQRQRQHGHGCKSGTLPQHAYAEAQILQQCFQEWKTAPVAIVFFGLLDAAQFHQCLPPRLLRTHSRPEIVFGVHLEMASHLFRKLTVAPFLSKQPSEP